MLFFSKLDKFGKIWLELCLNKLQVFVYSAIYDVLDSIAHLRRHRLLEHLNDTKL